MPTCWEFGVISGGQWQRALVFQQIAPRDGLVCGSAAIAAPAASLAPLLAELQSTALGAKRENVLDASGVFSIQYTCMYVYIYIYKHIHICICIYIYM